MTDEDKRLAFSFELIDNVTETADQIEESVDGADDSIKEYEADAQRAGVASARLTQDLQAQQMQIVTQLAILGSLGGAVNSINGGLQNLGLVSDQTAEQLTKISSAFNLIKGTSQGLVAVKGLMATLNAQTAINASLSTYLAVLKNPAMLAGVAVAGGAAAGFAGAYLMTRNNNTTNNNTTNVNIQGEAPRDAVAQIIDIFEGGAL